MCLGDWRLGRLIRSYTHVHTLATTESTSIGANPQRVGLIFGAFIPPSILGANLRISVDGIGMTALTNGTTTVKFTLANDGDLSTRSWTVLCNGATTAIGITELTMPEQYINAGIQEFMRSLQV